MKARIISIVLLLGLLFSGCTISRETRYLIVNVEGLEEYSKTLQDYLAGYEMGITTDTIYAEVAKGNAVACFDVQAIPAINQGVANYWYPHALSTVVIAVDRTQTDAVITGWKSLLDSKEIVGISSNSIIRDMLVMGSISYGLDPISPSKDDVLNLLKELENNDRFMLEDSKSPILLCLDHEVVAWNKAGSNYEIIVPKEGTLSFQVGLLSDIPLTIDEGFDDALLAAELPLANGSYPKQYPEGYQSAHKLSDEDYKWFLNVTDDCSRDLRRKVFKSRLYTTADLREHILFAIGIIAAILLWKGTVYHRMIRPNVSKVVSILCWLMVGWIMLRLFKYQLVTENELSRLCWYGYYIFQLALPVTLLYLTEIMDQAEDGSHSLNFMYIPFTIYILSVLLVLTNDWHQLVFIFDPNGNWAKDYSYGIGYWFIMIFFVLIFILAIIKLFCKGRRSNYVKAKVLLLLLCGLLFLYIIGYIYRVPLAWESDITIFICVIAVIFFETVLHTGLIPVNIQYQRLFANAPIGLSLLDDKGNMVLSSKGTPPISRSIWKRLCIDMDKPLLRDNDTQLHAISIHGGIAVWQENLAVLNRIRKEIKEVQIRLETANALLKEEEEVKKRLLQAETNRKLFEHLERDMESRINALVELVDGQSQIKQANESIALIILCLCHIKRRCNLFFLACQGNKLLGEELSVYLDELIELASYDGLKVLIRCGQSGFIGINNATICYDFAFETITWALKDTASVLMGYLENDDGCLMFRFLPGSDPNKWYFSDELIAGISKANGNIVYKDLDDAIGICLVLPLGGEIDG